MKTVRAHLILLALAIVVTSGLALTLSGQTETADTEAVSGLLERPDREALRGMSREERRAEMRAYRAKRLAAAREAGIEEGPSGYRPLAEPRTLADRGVRVPGTSIQYDSGAVTGFVTLADLDRVALNRFDNALNANGTMISPVQASGSVTMITFHMLRTLGSSVTWSLYSGVMGTSAMQVTSRVVPAGTGLNTINVGDFGTSVNSYMGSSFLVGILQFQVMFTRVGADSNSAAGQGFHAYSINEPQTVNPNTGMGLNSLGSTNFVVRASGNVASPVELMNFEIE